MIHRIITALWGEIHGDELKKFCYLALGMMFLIGSYWPLKLLKDSVFINTVGATYIPYIKLVSLLFFIPLIAGYSKLLDYFSRERMIYAMVAIFVGIGGLFSLLLAHPTIGVANSNLDPTRLIGWIFFIYVESYASLVVSLYWSYINDITTPESAKRGYGLIIFASQFGGLLSTLIGYLYARDVTAYHVTAPRTLALCLGLLACVAGVVYLLDRSVSRQQLAGYDQRGAGKKSKEAVGFVVGIRMIVTSPYVGGILGLILCSDLFDVVMSYQMNILVKSTYIASGMVNKFIFGYGLIIQIIATLIGLVGTSFFLRTFGVRLCLMLYPVLLAGGVLWYLAAPTLWVAAGLMIVAKSLSYAFNQPTKEILYIPTSKTVRYKSKAWMDMFGKRLGKGSGSLINMWIGQIANAAGSLGFGIAMVWGVLAHLMGMKFAQLTRDGDTIE